jgi:fatty-acyl-CoA synthase
MQGGYWKSKAQTDEVVDAEGWMHTGDTGVINERGFCRIDGRIKDMGECRLVNFPKQIRVL